MENTAVSREVTKKPFSWNPRRNVCESGWFTDWMAETNVASQDNLLKLESDKAFIYVSPPLKQGTDVTSEIEAILFKLSFLEVRLGQLKEIKDYLFRFRDLIDLILPVCNAARKRFGFQAQLALEVYHDPEVEDEYLVLYVRLNKYDESVIKRIKEIRKEYEGEFAGGKGWFLLTTDFRPPAD